MEPIRLLEQACQNGHYLGFLVVRPLSSAPIGRALLVPPKQNVSPGSHLLVKARYEAHPLGSLIDVGGAPFLQQDSRVSACAHASIWVSSRHFHTKHREGWFSTVDIAEKASTPTDITLAQSLPSGSGGLGLNNMIRALRSVGREPIVYIGEQPNNSDYPPFVWPNERKPEEIINRYVDSGIPVILGLVPFDLSQGEGHAVVCVGHVHKKINHDINLTDRPTRSIFCGSFLVHDDQRGVYLSMPVNRAQHVSSAINMKTPYNVEDHVFSIIVPLPGKVYIKGEIAELIAWNLIENYTNIWPSIRRDFVGNSLLGQDVIEAQLGNQIVARTYLTHGWKYKRRVMQNVCSGKLKESVESLELPRFVWVTEFGNIRRLNSLSARERKIFGHVVVDASTSEHWGNGPLVFHAPGIVLVWKHDLGNEYGPYNTSNTLIPNDCEYYPKMREDIQSFNAPARPHFKNVLKRKSNSRKK